MPPDVRHPRADLRSTLAIDRLTAIRAPPNLTPTTPRTAELRPKIANASHLPHRDPMQACKKLYALSLRVVNCRNPNSHWGVLQLALGTMSCLPKMAVISTSPNGVSPTKSLANFGSIIMRIF